MEKEEILFINKSKSESYPLADVIKVFKSSSDLNTIKSYVEKASDRVYVSWASVDAVDSEKQKIPINDVINQQDVNLKRGGVVSDEHTNANVGKTLAYKVLVHPITKTRGVLQLNKIYNDNYKDSQVWSDIVKKVKTGSSVGGVYNKRDSYVVRDNDSGNYVDILTDFNQFETAVCEKPINTYATIEANSLVAKSKKMTEKEIKKADDVVVDEKPVETSGEDFKGEVMGLFAKIGDRLDAIEEKISGAPSEEVAVEEQKAEEPKEEENPKEESEELSKALKKIKALESSVKEIKKSAVTQVVKSERPDQAEPKQEDVMKKAQKRVKEMAKSGKMDFAEIGSMIRKAQAQDLDAKMRQ